VVDRRPRRAGQRGDHVPPDADAWAFLQKKSQIAQEQRAEQRAAWRERTQTIDPARFVFLDETSTPTTLTPLRGWAPRTHRLIARVPRGRWHNVTLLSTLSLAGMGASVVIDGALNRRSFDAFVDQILVPTLRPGQIVVLDNLSVHRSARVRQLIESAGCDLWFLPTYSPDFNPIETAFAKIKQAMRRAAARSFDAIATATKPALNAVTTEDARGFFRHAGYVTSSTIGHSL
jgi:transposase